MVNWGARTAVIVVIPMREAVRSKSARGLAQSKTLARVCEIAGKREAFWSAVALYRFCIEPATRPAACATPRVMVESIYRFKTNRVLVADEFEVMADW